MDRTRLSWSPWSGLVLLLGISTLLVGGWSNGFIVPPEPIRLGMFSEMIPEQGLPTGWEKVSLAAAYEKTTYDLTRMNGTVVVRAQSDGGTAGLRTVRRVDPVTHPILRWRWRVDSIVEDGKAGTKTRSDFPARLFVAFDYNQESLRVRLKKIAYRSLGFDTVPDRALVYVWANRIRTDSLFVSPHASWLRMMALQSGAERVGTWVAERRNVRADYRRAFGEEAPPVEWVGFMTDTNNTGGQVTAYYGDIMFRAVPGDSGRHARRVVPR